MSAVLRRARPALLLTLLLAPTCSGALGPVLPVTLTPAEPRPGDVVLIRVPGGPAELGGEWDGRLLRFFPTADGPAALLGLDLDTRPGLVSWRLTGPGMGRVTLRSGTATVRPRIFETQRLTLPPGQVDLDPATLARAKAEQAEMAGVLAGIAAERLWRGPFLTPVDGSQPTGGFGLRRILNGQPRSPHTGFDWAAAKGTPVHAANAGRVALVGEYFFAGRLVILDHGLGLFTHYYHLDAIHVAVGDVVTRGQAIALVGATGRVTGAHLHFAVTLAGARVDPMALLDLALPPEGS